MKPLRINLDDPLAQRETLSSIYEPAALSNGRPGIYEEQDDFSLVSGFEELDERQEITGHLQWAGEPEDDTILGDTIYNGNGFHEDLVDTHDDDQTEQEVAAMLAEKREALRYIENGLPHNIQVEWADKSDLSSRNGRSTIVFTGQHGVSPTKMTFGKDNSRPSARHGRGGLHNAQQHTPEIH